LCLFDLVKANISEILETEESNKSNIHHKIRDLTCILQKYLKGIEDIDECKLDFNNEFNYTEEMVKNLFDKNYSSGEWVLVTLDNSIKK